jgi:uncharacterized protein (DUF927 family)
MGSQSVRGTFLKMCNQVEKKKVHFSIINQSYKLTVLITMDK